MIIDYSDGSSASFCPTETGLETFNPNEEIYTFSSTEGETIAVTTNLDNFIKKVEVRSNSFQCISESCGGVSISPPTTAGGKAIMFAGTMLRDHTTSTAEVSSRTAIISGTLTTLPRER